MGCAAAAFSGFRGSGWLWLCLELAAEFIDFCLEDIAFGGCGGGLADSGGFFFLEAGSCFLGFGEFLAGDAFHAADFFREGSDVALEGGFAGGGIAAGVGEGFFGGGGGGGFLLEGGSGLAEGFLGGGELFSDFGGGVECVGLFRGDFRFFVRDGLAGAGEFGEGCQSFGGGGGGGFAGFGDGGFDVASSSFCG